MTDVIMYDSEQAAIRKSVEGWVDMSGRFWADDEHMARWSSCTHKHCECGAVTSKSYTKCPNCILEMKQNQYNEIQDYRDHDGEEAVYSYLLSEYFFHKDLIYDAAFHAGVETKDLMLTICEPNYAPDVDADCIFEDLLPEDMYIEDIDAGLADLFADINEYINKNKPVISWNEGRCRTCISDK